MEMNKVKSKRILPLKVSPSKQASNQNDERMDLTQGSKSFSRKFKLKKKGGSEAFKEELK